MASEPEPEADIRVAPELTLFLRPARRGGPARVRCDGVSSLGHVVQSLGVPLTEVGALVVNGVPEQPRYRPRGGDVAFVLPVSRPQPVDQPRFLLDVHLGTLARRLRLVGVDAAYNRDADDDELIERANAARRVLLTQDRALLQRRSLWRGAYVRGARPDEQFADVLDRFAPPLAPWTRCTACNGSLAPAAKADIAALLKPGTRRTYESFARCQDCGRIYWRGAHGGRLQATVDDAIRIVGAARS
ncbi:MAG: Mut7-C RNAse domain-containing protein [Streptosporangiaceae bacterium]